MQDILIEPLNTRYRLKVYQTPDGGWIAGKLPAHLNGKHFGPMLIRLILYQHYHWNVIQLILLEQLGELGIDISSGKPNNLLIEEKDRFHQEKNHLTVGLQVSGYVNVDDTGARMKGKTAIAPILESILFLVRKHRQQESHQFFKANARRAFGFCHQYACHLLYAVQQNAPRSVDTITENPDDIANYSQWNSFLTQNGIVNYWHVQIATEGTDRKHHPAWHIKTSGYPKR